MADGTAPARPASPDKKVGLVLRGGGALGSYRAGVYEALASSEYLPDWVAAIIAGNAPEHRAQRLRSFWEEITTPTTLWASAPAGPLSAWQRRASALTADTGLQERLLGGTHGAADETSRALEISMTKRSLRTHICGRLRGLWACRQRALRRHRPALLCSG